MTWQGNLYTKIGVGEGDFSVNAADSGRIVKKRSMEINTTLLFCVTIGDGMIHAYFC